MAMIMVDIMWTFWKSSAISKVPGNKNSTNQQKQREILWVSRMLLGPWGLIVLTCNQKTSKKPTMRFVTSLRGSLCVLVFQKSAWLMVTNILPTWVQVVWIFAVRHTRFQHCTNMNIHKALKGRWLFFNRHHRNIIKTYQNHSIIICIILCLPWSSPLSSWLFWKVACCNTLFAAIDIGNNISSPTRLIPPMIHNKLDRQLQTDLSLPNPSGPIEFLLRACCFFPLAPPPWWQ